MSGTETLWRMPVEGGEPTQLAKVYATRPVVSPDGRAIACLYRNSPEGRVDIALLPFDGGDPVRLFRAMVTGIITLKWTADGGSLIHTGCAGRQTLCVQPVDGSPARVLVHYPEEQIFNFSVGRDGRIFLVRGLLSRDAVMITNYR